jgi:hypothetical protein
MAGPFQVTVLGADRVQIGEALMAEGRQKFGIHDFRVDGPVKIRVAPIPEGTILHASATLVSTARNMEFTTEVDGSSRASAVQKAWHIARQHYGPDTLIQLVQAAPIVESSSAERAYPIWRGNVLFKLTQYEVLVLPRGAYTSTEQRQVAREYQ